MPAAVTNLYGTALGALASGGVNWASDTIKCALLNDTYVFDQNGHEFFDDVSAFEAAPSGYTAGGQTLVNKQSIYSPGDLWHYLDADDPLWATMTGSAAFAVVYKSTGTPSTSQLLTCHDFGGNQNAFGVDFSVFFSVDGIIMLYL
jgi:hypothetical protein